MSRKRYAERGGGNAAAVDALPPYQYLDIDSPVSKAVPSRHQERRRNPQGRARSAVRRQRVILSPDLAEIYGVETRTLNQAVKRNADRFPSDFAFRVTKDEAMEAQRLRSQNVILKRGQHIKYLPLAFTEHGAIMAATVLNSPRAVHMSIFVVRAFLRLREWVAGHAELSSRLARLERRVGGHDHELKGIIRAVREMIQLKDDVPPRKIGFRRAEP